MNRYLIDSHALLWWAAEPHRLSDAARIAMSTGHNQLLVSTASMWEITIKQALGKLTLPGTLQQLVISARCSVLQITFEHLIELKGLPWHHKDPFDRMIIAQASADKLTLITSDREFNRYGIETLAG